MHERYLYRQIVQALSGSSPTGDPEETEDGKSVSARGTSRGGARNSDAGPSGKLPLDI
jgi:hypothetical protein